MAQFKSLKRQVQKARFWGLKTMCELGSYVAPKATADWGFELFLTPTRHPRPAREKQMLTLAEREDFPRGLAVWKFGTGNKKALLVHGWDGRGTQLGSFVPQLLDEGYQVVLFDFPGHGSSAGSKTHLLEWIDILQELWVAFGGFDLIIGHSLGGAAALLAQELKPEFRPKKIVSISAPNYFPEIFERFCNAVGIKGRASRWFYLHMDRLSKGRKPHVVFPSALQGSEQLAETLILHDPKDLDVSFEHAIQIKSALKKARLVQIPGRGHRRILRAPESIAAVAEFLASRPIAISELTCSMQST